ncbi:hypothetical protein ACLOJK_001619 [Asimina triloba]
MADGNRVSKTSTYCKAGRGGKQHSLADRRRLPWISKDASPPRFIKRVILSRGLHEASERRFLMSNACSARASSSQAPRFARKTHSNGQVLVCPHTQSYHITIPPGSAALKSALYIKGMIPYNRCT